MHIIDRDRIRCELAATQQFQMPVVLMKVPPNCSTKPRAVSKSEKHHRK
jgi:hypothetical protein